MSPENKVSIVMIKLTPMLTLKPDAFNRDALT